MIVKKLKNFMDNYRKFSVIRHGIPILLTLPVVVIVMNIFAYFFEVYFWYGLLAYVPLYFIYKKTSWTDMLTKTN